jgi:rSAM/selenodomain-associated transferase 2
MQNLSIVIPIYNEANIIEDTLKYLFKIFSNHHVEIIIVDGGSTDNSLELIQQLPVTIISSNDRSRAAQMNTGAKVATGDVLLFLHCDTRLPSDTFEQLTEVVNNSWGFFKVKLDGRHWMFRLIEFMINLRSSISKVATGDQCIFIGSKLFNNVKGFKEIPLMEDVELTKRLRMLSKPLIVNKKSETSSRRWQGNGILKTIFLMWQLRLLYFLGVSPKRLAEKYYG